jgi:hypothetical protein
VGSNALGCKETARPEHRPQTMPSWLDATSPMAGSAPATTIRRRRRPAACRFATIFRLTRLPPLPLANPRQCILRGLLKERWRRSAYVIAPDQLSPNAVAGMLRNLRPYRVSLAAPHDVRRARLVLISYFSPLHFGQSLQSQEQARVCEHPGPPPKPRHSTHDYRDEA